jgi:hypothetical protein
MKKFLVLLSLLLAAACTPTNTNTNTSTTTNANTSTERTAPAITQAQAMEQEKAAWDAIKKKDYAAFGNMLANDYAEVGSDGLYDKAASLDMMKDMVVTDATYSDWKWALLDKDAFVVTYTVTAKGSFKGQAFPGTPVRASSAWVNRDGKWLAIFHQETEVKKMPPPPPPKSGTKPAASPATPPATAGTSGPDPVANEKLVWDALKNKNYDAFAALLAPDSIEVEAEGVFDKAGSVEGVKPFDFSKATLSDWKTVKITDNASLVIYVVTIPVTAANGERHSTIWANRGGKWLAAFHQGTPIVKAAAAKPSPKATLK